MCGTLVALTHKRRRCILHFSLALAYIEARLRDICCATLGFRITESLTVVLHFLNRRLCNPGPVQWSWQLILLVSVSQVINLAGLVNIILGNVWVWGSQQCDSTSTPVFDRMQVHVVIIASYAARAFTVRIPHR